jgi:hypothetical protein
MGPISDLNIGTPALLFPAISLLLLAYTNRFLGLASVIRGLHARYRENRDPNLATQIRNLRRRVDLIRKMQGAGVLALLLTVLCMFAQFAGMQAVAKWLFGASLILMMLSLAISAREIQISTVALKVQLHDLEDPAGRGPAGLVPDETTDTRPAP